MRRASVVTALRADRSTAEVAEFPKMPVSTVYRIAKNFRECPDEAGRKRGKRNRANTARTPELIAAADAAIKADRSVSMNTLAARFDVSKFKVQLIKDKFSVLEGSQTYPPDCPATHLTFSITFAPDEISKTIHNDLKLFSFKLKIRHELTPDQIEKRGVRCRQLLA